MSDAVSPAESSHKPPSNPALPAICLNMIVRNEAHIVHEVLDAVAPYISYWVVVDTGSDDGTQDAIRNHMSRLGIPGELHERPWLNFGHNRTEALALAQGHGDYIWVMDADDTVAGTPDFTRLTADIYTLRIGEADEENFFLYRRPMLFRDGLQVRYAGAIHEYATWQEPYELDHLDGEYYVECRHLGGRENEHKYQRDRDVLLAEVEREPEDSRSVFYLAQTYFLLRDFVNAHKWYVRRAEMGGYQDEVYYALYRIAQSMDHLGEPWPNVQDAYLRAWEYMPSRAEPLFFISRHYRDTQRYQLGYAFAKLASEIPLPERSLQVRSDIYAWRAADDVAVCASWIGKKAEAFEIWRGLLTRPGLADHDRERIARNRDICVPTMIEMTSSYPAVVVQQLTTERPGADVTVTLMAGQDPAPVEQTLNSFLNCCLDASRIARFLLFDTGLSASDQARLQDRYGFLEFHTSSPTEEFDAQLDSIGAQINTRFWLHMSQPAQFFAPEKLITRLTAVIEAEPHVSQVGINYSDADGLTALIPPESAIRRTPDAGRYTLSDKSSRGCAMVDITRSESGAATLDEVLYIAL